MVHLRVPRHDPEAGGAVAPAYTQRLDLEPIPKLRMPEHDTRPETAYRLIHDELLLDGSSRLNLATFVTTWMEPEADKLMAEAFDKNMIDKDEYPQTAEIERRCVNMVAHLFNAPEDADAIGTSTIGSSEAVMLSGLAMKWKWRARREAAGKPTDKPNLVLGTNVQVVWEKFCRYWDVEARYIPMHEGRYVISPEEAVERIDENTIGVVAILGTTYTGEFEPIEAIHDAVVASNAETGFDVPVHVDAASGGFVAPFLHPKVKWDFRLPMVKSINVSGHKYGLTYPGVGFVVWRSRGRPPRGPRLPRELPGWRHAHVHPELLASGQPDRRASTTTSCAWGWPATAGSWKRLRDLAVHTSGRIARDGSVRPRQRRHRRSRCSPSP